MCWWFVHQSHSWYWIGVGLYWYLRFDAMDFCSEGLRAPFSCGTNHHYRFFSIIEAASSSVQIEEYFMSRWNFGPWASLSAFAWFIRQNFTNIMRNLRYSKSEVRYLDRNAVVSLGEYEEILRVMKVSLQLSKTVEEVLICNGPTQDSSSLQSHGCYAY